ncbi:MAG: tRNA(Ile)-lysidine synthase [Nonlabens sp.]|jgi:tRNA(Ile)-lysidine synthase|uniref:tRNA lysidine(34) synthetase TilS n=1 Tax=Nonlabens sp. TaxID=1888209 RepID=UPI0039E21ECB
MLAAFQRHIKSHFPELFSAPVAIAISGGKDSTVLAHLLAQLDIKFDLIHCNFNLRGTESEEDQFFVEHLAQHFDAAFHLESFETEQVAQSRGISIQMAARALRYEAFDSIAAQQNYSSILVAHHLDDQLETFLINLGRGAGLHGLTGIRARNGVIARPLLPFSRDQISEFATENDISWREDSSNSATKYLRNELRHDVIPLLHKALPHLKTNFSNTLHHLKGSELLLDTAVARFRESGTNTNSGLLEIHIASLKATVHPEAYLYELLKEYHFNLPDAMVLLEAENGKNIRSGTKILTKERDVLILSTTATSEAIYIEIDQRSRTIAMQDVKLELKTLVSEDALGYLKSLNLTDKILLDTNKIKWPLILRTWKHGDRMMPYGMQGSKLISDLLTDHKIPSLEREKVVVLISGSNIIWLVGIRASKHHKITSKTTSIIEITQNP